MNIIVKVNQYEDVFYLDNADGYLLSNNNFSYRYDHSFTLTQIKKINNYCKKNNKKIYLLVNKIFKDKDLESLEKYIKDTKDLDIDGYFFTDFAVFMILKSFNLENKSVFYHETFLRNSYDINTYQKYGIDKIICSKDMHIDDISHLDPNQKDKYGLLMFGYYPIYESYRKLVTNYINNNNLDKQIVDSHNLTIKEKTRDEHYRILEQKGISSVFADKIICNIEYVDRLKNNIDMFVIDSLFFDKEYIKKIIDLLIKSNSTIVTIDEVSKLDNSLSFTNAFLKQRVGLV